MLHVDKVMGQVSLLWRSIGPFCDFSKILAPNPNVSSAPSFTSAAPAPSEPSACTCTAPEAPFDELCQVFKEQEMLQRVQEIKSNWQSLFYSVADFSSLVANLHKETLQELEDLPNKVNAYLTNYKRVNQRLGDLASRRSLLQEKIAILEEMYGHYSRLALYMRNVTSMEDNEFIKYEKTSEYNLGKTLKYVEQIAESINEMLPQIDRSCDFFALHPDFYEAEAYARQYEDLRARIFSLIKQLFKELYVTTLGTSSSSPTTADGGDSAALETFDINEHYNKYRKIGSIARSLTSYYFYNPTEANHAELLQLQMYYVTNRIKVLNPIMEAKGESLDNFSLLASFFVSICNLEILIFKETFQDTPDAQTTMIQNVVYYFCQYAKKCVQGLTDAVKQREALETLRDNLIDPIQSSQHLHVLQPLLLKARHIYSTIEALLAKDIQSRVRTSPNKFSKLEYLRLYTLGDPYVFNAGGDEVVEAVMDYLKTNYGHFTAANLHPVVYYSLGLLLQNVHVLSAPNLTRIATLVFDVCKSALLDFRRQFAEICKDSKLSCKINQQLFYARHLYIVLSATKMLQGLVCYRHLEELLEPSFNQLVIDLADYFADFASFQRLYASQNAKEELQEYVNVVNKRLQVQVPLVLHSLTLQMASPQIAKHLLQELCKYMQEQISSACEKQNLELEVQIYAKLESGDDDKEEIDVDSPCNSWLICQAPLQ